MCFMRCIRFRQVFHALDGSGHKCFFSVRTDLARHALMIVRWDVRGNEKMEKRKGVKRKVESVTFLVVSVLHEIKK